MERKLKIISYESPSEEPVPATEPEVKEPVKNIVLIKTGAVNQRLRLAA